MNANLDKIAKDLYGKIQTRFPNIKIGDENATVLSKKEDIPNARFFEFEYTEDGEPLGTIAITLDTDDGIVVQVSGDLVNDDDETTHHGAYKFIRSFRQFAKDRLLNFDVQNIGKSNMDKRDYQFQAKRKEEPVMPQAPIMENKMYGNARMSYQDLGEGARLVVKHNQPVNIELAAGRTMHIESIYIENAAGERFKYPFKHLNGARALAEHIKHGGNPYDAIGKHISNLSEELASLRKFKGFVGRQEQVSEAMGSVTGRVIDRIDQIKETIHKLQRSAYYEAFVESFEEQEEQIIPEEVANDLINRLTVRTFNEELKSVFPYIAKFVKESELDVIGVGVDDLLAEGMPGMGAFADVNAVYQAALASFGTPGSTGAQGFIQKNQITDPAAIQAVVKAGKVWLSKQGKQASPEEQFESFMNNIISEDKDEIFSPNKDAQNSAIEKLNQILAKELQGGPEGVNAIESLKGLIDDPDFLMSLQDIDPDLDVRPLIQQFVLATDPTVATQLQFGDEASSPGETEAPPAPPAPAPAPVAPPVAPEAAPAPMEPAPAAAPVAEGRDEDPPFDPDPPRKNPIAKAGKHGLGHSTAKHLAHQGIKAAIEKAKKAGATLDTELDFGHKKMSLHDAIKESGMVPSDVGFTDDTVDGISEMMKFISGFYDRENGAFPLGSQRIKIKLKKEFEDGVFGNADPADLMKVMKFIDMKDPSSDHHQQHAILKLAGVRNGHEIAEEPVDPRLEKLNSLLSQLGNMPGSTQTSSNTSSNTSSGTINGQPANYDDVMGKFNDMTKNMKLKFGDQELDLNNPDQMGDQLKNVMGGMMKGVQGQMPNQNVQFPGGQMNPSDMMKQIMQKINFGK